LRFKTINNQEKFLNTPSFFITNNFGGGGTNVSRLLSYLGVLDIGKINLLLNYYYLNTKLGNKMVFDRVHINKSFEFENIENWVEYVRGVYIETEKKTISEISLEKLENLNYFLLDSGSGNIFRNIIEDTSDNILDEYAEIIKNYHNYTHNLKFNILIALDFAKKYTYKAGEKEDEKYVRISDEFGEDLEKNRQLIKLTIEDLQNRDFFTPLVFAPIHGNSPNNYLNYLKSIIEIEKKYDFKFDGFAIGGGIANSKGKYENIWQFPKKLNRFTKSAYICSIVTKRISDFLKNINDDRTIHILGAGNHFNILPLWICGADTYDCHSSWRRATENKILIPLLNSNGNYIKNKNIFHFKKLSELNNSDFNCECEVCQNYSLNNLKELTIKNKKETTNDKEKYYYGEILVFFHAIYQYEYLLNKFKEFEDIETIQKFIMNIPDKNLQKNYIDILKHLKNIE